jgi:hypothetical protein
MSHPVVQLPSNATHLSRENLEGHMFARVIAKRWLFGLDWSMLIAGIVLVGLLTLLV